MRICNNHDQEIPLIPTYAFMGAEYWCPYCGANYGMLGAGKIVNNTDELEGKLKKYRELSGEFLRAKGTQACDETKYDGKWIKPAELPEEVKQQHQEIINNWKYGQIIE